MDEEASGQPSEDPAAPRTDQRMRSTAKHALAVTSLLERRPTMRGVSGLADQVDESVRWAV